MLELQFILTYDNTDYVVDEPDGFKSFNSVLERDFDTHGVFFRFTDSDLKLKFPGTGRDVLKAARDGFGIDAVVDLTVKRRYRSTDSFVTIYTGTAIIENLELDEDFASCDFEEINDMIKIKDRLDVIVSTDATEDLDGGAISAATEITVTNTGKGIEVTSSGNVTENTSLSTDTSSIVFKNVAASVALYVDELSDGEYNLTALKNDIEYFDGKKGFSSDASLIESGVDPSYIELGGRLNSGPLYNDATVTVALSGQVNFVNGSSNQGRGTVSFRIVEYTLQSDGTYSETTVTTIDTYDLSAVAALSGTTPTISGSNTYDVKTGEVKYFKLRVSVAYSGGSTDSQNMNMNVTPGTANQLVFSLTFTQTFPNSDISAYFIHEALRHNVHAVSGNDMLYAPFFGRTADGYDENGCAWNYAEANGYRVRAFSSRPNQMSLKDRLDSLKAIFGVGYGIERDAPEYDTYRFRVDTYDYWYNSELLYEFSDVVDYKEEYFDWFSFNEFEIGYKKYANDEDEPGTVDDWNTKAGYLMPVGRLRGKKSFLSDYIGSTYLHEYTRRKQFTREPTTSWKYDDDQFIMDVQDSSGEWIIGSPNSVAVFGFENSTVFNRWISPRFNFFNQYLLLNSLAYRKIITDQYKNTFYRNNGTGKISYSNFSPTTNCLGDLAERSPFAGGLGNPQLNANITLSEMRDANRLFDPLKISFKQALSTTQLDNIIEAHRNGAASSNNGFFRVTSPDGETIEGWLLRLSFNYADQIGNFELIKKADAYSI